MNERIYQKTLTGAAAIDFLYNNIDFYSNYKEIGYKNVLINLYSEKKIVFVIATKNDLSYQDIMNSDLMFLQPYDKFIRDIKDYSFARDIAARLESRFKYDGVLLKNNVLYGDGKLLTDFSSKFLENKDIAIENKNKDIAIENREVIFNINFENNLFKYTIIENDVEVERGIIDSRRFDEVISWLNERAGFDGRYDSDLVILKGLQKNNFTAVRDPAMHDLINYKLLEHYNVLIDKSITDTERAFSSLQDKSNTVISFLNKEKVTNLENTLTNISEHLKELRLEKNRLVKELKNIDIKLEKHLRNEERVFDKTKYVSLER